MYKKTKKMSKGFTLVETLVSISILSLSIAATFTAVQNGIFGSTVAKDRTTAFYLAQEGMEYIKNIRDNNALYSIANPDAPQDWLSGLAAVAGDPCFPGKVCQVDSPAKQVTNCGSASISSSPPLLCPNLRQEDVTGLFGYNSNPGWTLTNFKREIQFQASVTNPGNEVTVYMTISWTSHGAPKSFQVTELFLNKQ